MYLANRNVNNKQWGFLRSSAAFAFGLLFLILSQFSQASLSIKIGDPATLLSTSLPKAQQAEAIITATFPLINEGEAKFDQPGLALTIGEPQILTLNLTNTGINELANGFVYITIPDGLDVVFLPNDLYSVIQLADGRWLVTLAGPMLPGTVLGIPIQLTAQVGAPDTFPDIIADFQANGVGIRGTVAALTLNNLPAILFLSHQVDKTLVTSDEAVRYTLSVTNNIKVGATENNVVLTDILPFGVRLIPGTASLNGMPVLDPVVAADGVTLTFPMGDIDADQTSVISFMAYVTGVVQAGKLVSDSIAKGDTAVSNPASATIEVQKDLMNIDSHVVGRVLLNACAASEEAVGQTNLHISNTLIDDDILYTITVTGEGAIISDYNVEMTLPTALNYVLGSTVKDDTPTADPKIGGANIIFNLGKKEGSWKQKLTFRARPDPNKIGVFEWSLRAKYDIEGHGSQVSPMVKGKYEARVSTNESHQISFWPKFKSLDATLQEVDRQSLNELTKDLKNLKGSSISRISVTGHTDNQVIRGNGIKKFADNKVLSKARAQSIADYLFSILTVEREDLIVAGKGSDEPVADNDTEEGRQQNRRVDLSIETSNNECGLTNHIVLGDDVDISAVLFNKAGTGKIKVDKDTQGLGGIRLFMEDGRFTDTDATGSYHFEGLKPGTHILQLDKASIPKGYEAYQCEENTRFARTPISQFLDVSNGLVWRSDFHIRTTKKVEFLQSTLKLTGEVEKSTNIRAEENTYKVNFQAFASGSAIPSGSVELLFKLPSEIVLDEKSVSVDGVPATVRRKGDFIKIGLPAPETQWVHSVKFVGTLTTKNYDTYETIAYLDITQADGISKSTKKVSKKVGLEREKAAGKNYVLETNFGKTSTELSNTDKQSIDKFVDRMRGKKIEKISVVGHTDACLLSGAAKDRLGNNDNLSKLRADQVADYLKSALSLNANQVVVSGLGSSKPVANNETAEDRAKNRRIELRVVSPDSLLDDVTSTLVDTSNMAINTSLDLGKKLLNAIPITAQDAEQKPVNSIMMDRMPVVVVDNVKKGPVNEKTADIPVGILSIAEGDVIASASTTIRINVDSRLKQDLYIDDKLIPSSRVGFKLENRMFNRTIYTYFGVELGEPGDHTVTVIGLDPFGNERFNQVVNFKRSGAVKKINFVDAEGNIADGITPVKARIEMFDKQGAKINATAELMIAQGDLQPYVEGGANKQSLVTNASRMVTVGLDGVVKFNPIIKPGLYRVKLVYNEEEVDLNIYVKPKYRDWVMVGVVDGTLGFNEATGNMENLESNEIDDEFYDDGKVAFYAKGKVKGKYLLTVSYDSSKEKPDERLLQLINPNEYYTLYGDNTEQIFDAPSKEKLYVRLDADQFYALFGDYQTELDVTELSRYSRSFTGVKGVYETDRVSVNSFAAQTSQVFKRDEILGDGTSGLYHLSNKNIVANSEVLKIQVRDRFHSERIIKETQLSRFADYNLDYSDGALYFKQPIARHDENFNPVYIVVDYESFSTNPEGTIAGVRGALKFNEDKVEIGATVIDEGVQGSEGQLTGVDGRFDFTKELQLKTEYATTTTSPLTGDITADAFLVELKQSSAKFEGSVYARGNESGFGLGQLNQSENGMSKYGTEGTYLLRENLELNADIGHQENDASITQRDAIMTNLLYKPEEWEFSVGGILADDKTPTQNFKTETLTTGVAKTMLEKRLRVYQRSEWQLNQDPANVDFPERHIFGTDYRITDRVSVFGEHEFAEGLAYSSQSTRAGVRSTPWTNASMTNAVQNDIGEFEGRTFSVFGLTQSVPIDENWKASFSYDTTTTIERDTYTRLNEDVPLASGSTNTSLSTNGLIDEDFWATTAGLGYQSVLYLFDTRMEYRDTDTQTKTSVFSAWQRNLIDGIGHGLRFQSFLTDYDATADDVDTQLRYSLVIRPLGSQWFWFNRSELKYLEINSIGTATQVEKFVEHLAINYVPVFDWQAAIHLGYKLTKTATGADPFITDTYLLGSEVRHDLTPRWDVGGHFHVINTPEFHLTKESYGFSFGVDLKKNLWLSMGYNVEGYSDDDFTANGYTAQGPYLKLRFKFDQDTFDLK